MKHLEFTDRKIMITGAANGLGLTMAEYLAERGADLVLTDIDSGKLQTCAEEINKKGDGEVLWFEHDVASEAAWKTVFEQVSAKWSVLDGLVNNAGIMLHKPFVQTTLEMFQLTQKVNVDSVFIGVQTFLPLLKASGDSGDASSVVNVSSIFGQVSGPIHSAYCASKGAVTLLTKSIATELPKMGFNVRCNSIHPGVMDVGVSITGLQSFVELGQFASTEEASEYFANVIPLGRPGRAEEIAAGVAFLLSNESSLMTGSELTLDGGYTAI